MRQNSLAKLLVLAGHGALSLIVLSCLLTSPANAQGKISGYMFGDYFYNAARDTGIARIPNAASTGDKSFQGFQLRRIYFTYDNDISDQFTARFRLEADQGALSSDGKISTFVKDAYLRWKNIFAGSDLYFGMQPTAAFEISEAAWGYRSLEKTIMDLRGIVPSRDIGLALRGKIDDAGVFNYWIALGNGSGNRPEGDKFKRMYAQVWLKPTPNFQATLYADYNARPNINDPFSTTTPPATLSNGILTYAAFVGYAVPDAFNVGAEGFISNLQHGTATATEVQSRNTLGASVWASVTLAPEWALVGRYDYFDSNLDAGARGDMRGLIIGSLVYKPNKNVSIMPNVEVETYESLPNGGRSIDPSVTARLTFYYLFL